MKASLKALASRDGYSSDRKRKSKRDSRPGWPPIELMNGICRTVRSRSTLSPRSDVHAPTVVDVGNVPAWSAGPPASRPRSRARGTPRRRAGNGDRALAASATCPPDCRRVARDRSLALRRLKPPRSAQRRLAGSMPLHRAAAPVLACVDVGVIVAPAGAAATASKAAATSAAAGATAPRLRLLTRPPEYRRIRATPHPRDAYCLGARRLRASPRHFFPALLLAARAARAR